MTSHEAVTILQGDALQIMRTMPSESFDAIVTDPPFGLAKKYMETPEVGRDDVTYWSWLEPFVHEMLRLLRPGGFLAIWQAGPYLRYAWQWFGDDIHIYAAAKNFVQLRPTAINYGWDPVVMKYKAGAKPLNSFSNDVKPPRSIDWSIGNTAVFVTQRDSFARKHPCPRPINQVIEIVQNFTLPKGRLLDPFAGSGTTAVAALVTGRSCVSIEIEPEFCKLIEERLLHSAEEAP